jgi:hypothetical protein
MKYYLEDIQPKTEVGREIKRMVENGDHCDGNIYWLIQELEDHGLWEPMEKEIEYLRGELKKFGY